MFVTRIQVLNRADCCGGRINGARVMVGGHQCGVFRNPRQGAWITFNCRRRGNFVKIIGRPRQYLHFCGIKVWGVRAVGAITRTRQGSTKTISITNIRLNRQSAKMSSYWKDKRVKVWNVFKTHHFNARWGQGAFTCIHTLKDPKGAWWQVNLYGSPLIYRI